MTARTTLGAGLLVGAGLAAVAALTLPERDREPTAASVVASAVPSTIGPLVTTGKTSGPVAGSVAAAGPDTPATTQGRRAARTTGTTTTTTTTTTIAASTTTTTLPPSPLQDQVGDAISVEPVAPIPVVAPLRLTIEALGVNVPVRAVGLEPDGQLEIPDETEVGWYRLGSAPGAAGASVIAGHVSWNDTVGPFQDLSTLEPGATVRIDLADGSTRTYEVVERAQYPKRGLPVERIWAIDGPETLVLITCGGAFNPEIRRYDDNIVVYAVPVASA